jgi:hypothetical protein
MTPEPDLFSLARPQWMTLPRQALLAEERETIVLAVTSVFLRLGRR